MVIGTIFGNHRGHVWLCFQHDRLATKPLLLLELSVPTHQLVKEMKFGLVRIALDCSRPELRSCPLRSVPVWTMNCNGKKLGFAAIAAPSNPTHSSVGPIASLPSSTSSAPPAPTESSASCTPSCPEDLLDWTRSRVRRAATTSGCRS
ncbi:unnamed protein product [Linum tenue]|uniref:Uncharacterized protein n=2 Tax=Linum tenue TaxID=586396 RepID=A0AAV0I9M6_9ROSI|nr:unnamed protein product [Linum tenue]